MPLFMPDPTYTALQALPGRRRRRNWTPPGTSGPPTLFLSDSFTGTDGTVLGSHTGETGASWTKITGKTGDATINSNRAWVTTGTDYYASGVPASPDYDVTANMYIASALGFSIVWVTGRVDTSTWARYGAALYYDGSTWWNYLIKFTNASTRSDLAAGTALTAPTVGSSHTLTLRMVGNQISVLYDGVTKVGPVTDSSIAAAGRAGLGGEDGGAPSETSTTGQHFDSISATN